MYHSQFVFVEEQMIKVDELQYKLKSFGLNDNIKIELMLDYGKVII